MKSGDFNGKAVNETVTGSVEETSTDIYTNQIFYVLGPFNEFRQVTLTLYPFWVFTDARRTVDDDYKGDKNCPTYCTQRMTRTL